MARVLVIEDDTDNRLFLQELLRLNTHEVHTARDGQDALSWLRTEQLLPDCILLDLDMPIMTGQEFFRQLRGDPRFSRIRVIILSGDLHRHANDLPRAALCLEKPAPPDVLVDVVTRCASFHRDETGHARKPPVNQ
jgi:CheY-like chemotaxis protein